MNRDDLHLRRSAEDGIAIKADVCDFVNALLAVLTRATEARCVDVAQYCRAAINANLNSLTETQQFHGAVLTEIRNALPKDGVLTTDMTQIAYTGNSVYPCWYPNTWLHPVGFGTLGYAVPAAIGASV